MGQRAERSSRKGARADACRSPDSRQPRRISEPPGRSFLTQGGRRAGLQGVYYTKRGGTLLLLLAGGDKSTQTKDIAKALELKRNFVE